MYENLHEWKNDELIDLIQDMQILIKSHEANIDELELRLIDQEKQIKKLEV